MLKNEIGSGLYMNRDLHVVVHFFFFIWDAKKTDLWTGTARIDLYSTKWINKLQVVVCKSYHHDNLQLILTPNLITPVLLIRHSAYVSEMHLSISGNTFRFQKYKLHLRKFIFECNLRFLKNM